MLVLSGCGEKKSSGKIKFGTCADYPPFEYYENGELKGFDIDIARIVAKEIGKEAEFEDMQFCSILASLQNDSLDAAISTITSTPERRKNFDLSRCYYAESIAAVYMKNEPHRNPDEMINVKVACQLGSTMEIWAKTNATAAQLVIMDNNGQIIEALKAGQVDCVLLDNVQAQSFCNVNPELAYNIVAKSDEGYAIIFKKQSDLREKVNAILKKLEQNGELKKLMKKWQLPEE
jgi:polar amino acid transport system substrate-binding protein